MSDYCERCQMWQPCEHLEKRKMSAKKRKCVIGEYCHEHGFTHGAEAEELRERLEALCERGKVRTRDIRILLDNVDARDSLSYLETLDA